MSANLRLFTRAVYAFDAVVRRVDEERWDSPSPCPGWSAADVVHHQCAVLQGVIDMARSGRPARPRAPEVGGGPARMWDVVRDDLLDSLDHLGVLHQTGPFWFDAATIDELVALVAWDPTTHAWDLAVATGVDHGLADDLLEAIEPTVVARLDGLVASNRIAPPLEAADDASVLERYLGLVGRGR